MPAPYDPDRPKKVDWFTRPTGGATQYAKPDLEASTPDPRRPVVYLMDEGDWLVRGTQDIDKAVAAILESDEYRNGIGAGESANEAKETAAAITKKARPGLYRKNPVGKNSWEWDNGWRWQLGYCTSRGPGVFEGVYFQSW